MNIGVIGAGNIGMRYVQGITSALPEARVFVVDRRSRIDELASMELGHVELATSLDDIEADIDLFAIATSCAPRLALYKSCLARRPAYVILEKYLFSSRSEFEECLALARVPTFVNQWMFGSGAFDPLFDAGATTVEVSGSGWGLACNAVHWIDVLKRQMQMPDLDLGSDTVVTDVFPAKREGYEEISGELVLVEPGGDKSFRLIDRGQQTSAEGMTITVDDRDYLFDFSAIRRGDTVVSRFTYISSLIGGIVNDIMTTGRCHLPVLEESISQHLLVETVLERLDRRPNVT